MNRKQRREAAVTGGGAVFAQAFQQGIMLHQAGHMNEAAMFYRRAYEINPADSMLLNNYSVLLYSQGKMDEALAMQRDAVRIDPNNGLAQNNLGVTLNALHRHPEAIPAFRRAVELQPGNSRPINNLGDSLVKSGHFQQGLEQLGRALAYDPSYAEAHSNYGMALWGLGRLDEAIASIRHALKLQPSLAQARKNLGIVLLMKGDFAEGWKEYEFRPVADALLPRDYKMPRWQGQNLGEGKLLVFSEQGVGDEILYANMIRDLQARGLRILWEADPRLVSLFKRSAPAAEVVARTIPPVLTYPPDVVAQIPIASLGQYLRNDKSHFPQGSYLKTDRARANRLRAELNLRPGEKLVGMSWLSKNIAFGENKSTTLDSWAEILRIPGLRFVDLQYGDTVAERTKLKQEQGIDLLHVDGLDLREDLDGVASLVAACDLVVTVSNTTAHIAGGLGIPTWVMVPVGVGKFWYWGHNTDTTPWYPSVTVVRQEAQMDWRPTLQRVAERLRAFAGT